MSKFSTNSDGYNLSTVNSSSQIQFSGTLLEYLVFLILNTLLVTSYFADSYSEFIGYSLRCVNSQVVLWAGHCVRGCCIRANLDTYTLLN